MARLVLKASARDAINAAVRDRREHVGFVAARLLRERIMNGIYRIRDYPEIGRRLLEYPDANIRMFVVPPYRILYEFSDDTVTILDVVHGRSLSPDVDDEDLGQTEP
jgi:plasmid stabilization system protein ParE